jgi:subtilisin family serine protease
MHAKERIPGRYIVILKESQPMASIASEMTRSHRGKVIHRYRRALNGFAVELTERRMRAMANDPRVAYIEADRIVRINASQSAASWGLDRVDQRDLPLDGTYNYNTNSAAVNAYVIDTGIRLSHNEFAGRAQAGFTSINDGIGSSDCNGHGTHVAATVGGGTYGVAKEVNLYAVRVLDCDGAGFLSGVIAGVDWVTDNHIAPAVANMSLGGEPSPAMDDAIRNSVAAGVSYIVAAGNEDADACNSSPARIDSAITVGASTITDARASFSNWGACVDVFAPGSAIISAGNRNDNDSRTLSGTSMAAPHVTGVAALYMEENPDATPAQVINAVKNTATADRLTSIRTSSPNRFVYSLLSSEDSGNDGDTGSSCPSGYETFTGTLAGSGDRDYHPNGTYYFSASGSHKGELEGANNTNYDLYLWKWNGARWSTVARSTNQASEESINYNGTSGYYVWRIESKRGSGDYSFCMQRP